MNKTLDTSTWFFMEITVELPNGQRDLYKLLNDFRHYKLKTWNESINHHTLDHHKTY